MYACRIETISINVETILQKSFCACKFLNKIIIGENVKHLNAAFGYNKGLKSVELSSDNKNFKLIDNCLINSKGTQLVLYIQQAECTKLIIPSGIERVCGGAIQGESYLTEIILPQTLRYIGFDAFAMTNIQELHIPAEVVSISDRAFPKTIERLYFYSEMPPTMNVDVWFLRNASIFVPKGCVNQYKQKWEKYSPIIKEAEYEFHKLKPRKEIKNRAFYRALVCEIKEMSSIEIINHAIIFNQGRFEGCSFLAIWSKNLYYIKWMVRLGAIIDIKNDVFCFLFKHYPLKSKAIKNLKALLTVSQIKRAKTEEEAEKLKQQYLEYMFEIVDWKMEQDALEESNRLFEEMMNEYEAWGNID